ncbi:uncharacterized protein LOC115925220 [Strongylocentrotus purpuratus]|uniref:Uncharacterized protein n=1 Tax=Strongylocentrotus purpuratus TaxID=7668 RepID=A0A7M7P1L4_STRPU|nr:uncharacterized protein LOC115925220 [Strongylocentrotus purpuratus]
MTLKGFLLLALLANLFRSPTNALKSRWSPCNETIDCGHRPWKTTVCIDCRNRRLENPPEWSTNASSDAIDFSGNSLRDTNISLDDGISLTYLSLSQNEISTIGPWDDDGLKTLRYVYLDGNRIKGLPKDVFGNLTELRWLDLSNNEITSEHIDLFWAANGSQLVGLDLSSNLLSALTRQIFIGLSFLTNVYLWDNRINVLESGWGDGLQNLRHLIISHNRLSEISNITFSGLRKLDTLHLQFNCITHLEDWWMQDLQNLRNLDLSYNNISHIYPQTLLNLSSLAVLNLMQNPMVDIYLPVYPMLKTLYISNILIKNVTLLLDMIPPNVNTLYVDEDQWNLTAEAVRCNLNNEGIDVVIKEIHKENLCEIAKNISTNETVSPPEPVSSKWAFWFLLLVAIGLVAAIVVAAFCLYRAIVRQHHCEHEIHIRKKQSIVYVPFTESLRIMNSASSSRCGTLEAHRQDETKPQGCSVEIGRPALKRNQSGLAAAFSELHKVQCSSGIDKVDMPVPGSKFHPGSSDGGEIFITEGLHERKQTTMLSFKPMGYRQRRRNSLPDRPMSQNKDGWLYEIIPPESDNNPSPSHVGRNVAQLRRDSKLLYQNIAGRCWTSRAERLASQRMKKSNGKYNLLRSLSTPTELETENDNCFPPIREDAPPVTPRPIITLTPPTSNSYEDVETVLYEECDRHEIDQVLSGETDFYDDVFDDDENYIVVLPSDTDKLLPEAKEEQVDERRLSTPSGKNDIETSNGQHSQTYENFPDRTDDTHVDHHDYVNAAFTEIPNCDDESLDDFSMGLSESDEEKGEDRIQLYGDDGKLLRIPSVRDSVLTQSTFETVSLLLSVSGENMFSSTSSFEFDEDDHDDKAMINSEMHTL